MQTCTWSQAGLQDQGEHGWSWRGGVRHKSAPAQGIAALRVVCEENGVQGPMNDL